MSPSRVSVVVPTRDRPEFLAQALSSVRALEGEDVVFEILVCDNGQNPATADVAERFAARHIEVVRPGAAIARNAGLRAATGEYVAFLDDDDVWLPDHVRPQLRLLSEQAAFAAAIGQTCNAGWDLQTRGEAWPATLPGHGRLFGSFLTLYPQIGATVIRTSALSQVGLFDEALVYDQDWDWHLRLARRCAVGFVPVPCVLFRQRPPGYNDDLQWQRLRFFRRVLVQNVRSAGSERPPLTQLVKGYLAHSGSYAGYFGRSARVHALAGERRAALRCLWRALAASPPHAARDALRPSTVVAATKSFRRRPSRATTEPASG